MIRQLLGSLLLTAAWLRASWPFGRPVCRCGAILFFSLQLASAPAHAGSWVILAKVDPAIADPSVIDVAGTALAETGEYLVPQEWISEFFERQPITSAEISPADLANVAAGVGAAHVLAVEITRTETGLGYRLQRFDAADEKLYTEQGEVPATALVSAIHAAILVLMAAHEIEATEAPDAVPPDLEPEASPVPEEAPGAEPPVPAPPGLLKPPEVALPPPAPTEPIVTWSPMVTAPVPGEIGNILHGRGWRAFFGISPGTASESQGLTGGTGITNAAIGFRMGLAVFGGGSYLHYDIGPNHTLRLEVSGRVTLSTQLDAPTGGSTWGGYALSLSLDVLSADFLYYVLFDPLPVFIGAWGSASDATFNASQPSGGGVSPPAPQQNSMLLSLPFRVSVGGGIGRIYPVHWRIVVKRLEKVLIEDGSLTSTIPDHIVKRIVAQWYADRDTLKLPYDADSPYGWSYHRQVLSALQILKDAGLLQRPIHMLSAYRSERILVDTSTVDRWYGWELRGGLRAGPQVNKTWLGGTEQPSLATPPPPEFSLTIEILGRSVFNLSLESDLRFEPSLGIALLNDGEPANNLLGARRVSLDAAPAVAGAAPFLPNGRFVFDLPLTYARYIYDPSYNLSGFWNIHLAPAVGVANSNFGISLAAGVTFTFFSDSRTGYTLGLNGGIGYLGQFRYGVNLVAVIGLGTGETSYTAPDQVGDELPFNTDWLPYPDDLGDR